jgi:hypothetical protein
MKPLGRLLISLALASIPGTALPQSAFAAHPRVTPLDCRAAAAKYGAGRTWQASFAGSRGGPGTWDMYERTYEVGCFARYADCFNWLYWEQSDWPNDNVVGRCRQGIAYSG